MAICGTDGIEILLTDDQRAMLHKAAGMTKRTWNFRRIDLAAMAMLARHRGSEVLMLGSGANRPFFEKPNISDRPARLLEIPLTEEQTAQILSAVGMRATAITMSLDDQSVNFSENWISREAVTKVRCEPVAGDIDRPQGMEFVIVRGSDETAVGESQKLIRLPLGRGSERSVFGTGDHGSTQCSLQLLNRFVRPGMKILDIGTGSGVLTVAAIRLGASCAAAVDISPEAVDAAMETFQSNEIDHLVTTEVRESLDGLCGFDLLVGNLFTNIILRLVHQMAVAVRPGGIVIVSGFVPARGEDVEAAFLERGMSRVGLASIDGWEARAYRAPQG